MIVRYLQVGAVVALCAGCASDPATDTKAPPPPGTPTKALGAPPPKANLPADAAHKVVYSDESRIRFHFDDTKTTLQRLSRLAQDHCAKFDRSTQPAAVQPMNSGVSQAEFACVGNR